MENLIATIRRTGFLIILGLCGIMYIAFGIIYFQQGPKQTSLLDQINKVSIVVSKQLPSDETLKSEYQAVNKALSPKDNAAILGIIVGIAEKSGINVEEADGKFLIPPLPDKPVKQKVGGGEYQVLPINNIKAQGDYDSVMAFITDLDSGTTMKQENVTIVLKRVELSQVEVTGEGEEETKTETRAVVDVDFYTKPSGS